MLELSTQSRWDDNFYNNIEMEQRVFFPTHESKVVDSRENITVNNEYGLVLLSSCLLCNVMFSTFLTSSADAPIGTVLVV